MLFNKEKAWLLREKYHSKETRGYFADVQRLEAGLPLAYVIGWVDFLGCRIDLSARPLIPRPETEFWVEKAVTEMASQKNSVKILDLFSGSGCIGVALLKHLPHATVDFGEKGLKLCKQIEKNVALNNIAASRVCIIQTDVFSNITDTYDYIFANPPYVDPTKKEAAQDSVLKHEPHQALFAKDCGLYFIKKLLAEGGVRLKENGVMYIEFGVGQKTVVEKFARKYGWKAELAKDQFGKWRVVRIK